MSKQCRYCGAMLPDEANFCPHCAKSQTEKEEQAIPVPKRKKLAILGLILAAAVIAALVIWYVNKPKTYDTGGAEVVYKTDNSVWHILLRNSIDDEFHWTTPQGTFSRMCTAGTQGAVPLQLYAYNEETGESAAEAFLSAMETSEITAAPRDGAVPMEYSTPDQAEGFPLAALLSNIVFNTDCGTNDITWTIHMKNRDTVVLHEVIEIQVNPEISYSWKTTPMNTTEELQALLEQIKEEIDNPNTVVNISLAPVVYEGDLNILERAVNLTGSTEGNDTTVFTGCITVDNRNPLYAAFTDIRFEGPGTGICATEGFLAENCVFSGKDTGIMAADGSWPIPSDCVFENCGIGLHFNSTTATMRNAYSLGLSFINNETGIYLEQVPAADDLYYVDCVFENNKEDIKNEAGNKILYSLEEGT